MDHKTLISTVPKDDLARLNALSDAPGLRHLAGHLAMIAGFGLWIALGWPLWQLALVGQGIVICFMVTLEHEATTNRAVRFLAWNMPYHVEHHSLPQVPFHQLPALHEHMQGHHRVTAHGYTRFTAEYLRHL